MVPNDPTAAQPSSPPSIFNTTKRAFSLFYSELMLFIFFLCFNNGGVGGGVLLSWPKFFLFVDAQLILSTDNSENDNYG